MRFINMNIEDYKRCPLCEGRKRFSKGKCKQCNGIGYVKK